MWLTRVVLPLPRKPAMTVTGRRAPSGGSIGDKGVGRADSRLADPVAERIGERVQRTPAGAMAGDDVFDAERSQPLDRLWNNRFHYAAQMQSSHHAVDRNTGEQPLHLGADIEDARMRAGADDDQSLIAHMDHKHAFVHQQRIRLPRRIRAGPTEVIDAALFKGGHPRNFAAVVEMAVEQQTLFETVHNRGAMLLQFRGRRNLRSR